MRVYIFGMILGLCMLSVTCAHATEPLTMPQKKALKTGSTEIYKYFLCLRMEWLYHYQQALERREVLQNNDISYAKNCKKHVTLVIKNLMRAIGSDKVDLSDVSFVWQLVTRTWPLEANAEMQYLMYEVHDIPRDMSVVVSNPALSEQAIHNTEKAIEDLKNISDQFWKGHEVELDKLLDMAE